MPRKKTIKQSSSRKKVINQERKLYVIVADAMAR